METVTVITRIYHNKFAGPGSLSGKILFQRIIENNKISIILDPSLNRVHLIQFALHIT